MAANEWKDRISEGREALTTGAREAAAQARSRIEASYGTARKRADELSRDGRELAEHGLEAGAKAAEKGKVALDKAMFKSRGFISERPLAAVAVGVAAGVLLGLVAHRALRAKPEADIDDGAAADDGDED